MVKCEDSAEKNNIPDFDGMNAIQNSKIVKTGRNRKTTVRLHDTVINGIAEETPKKQKIGISHRDSQEKVPKDSVKGSVDEAVAGGRGGRRGTVTTTATATTVSTVSAKESQSPLILKISSKRQKASTSEVTSPLLLSLPLPGTQGRGRNKAAVVPLPLPVAVAAATTTGSKSRKRGRDTSLEDVIEIEEEALPMKEIDIKGRKKTLKGAKDIVSLEDIEEKEGLVVETSGRNQKKGSAMIIRNGNDKIKVKSGSTIPSYFQLHSTSTATAPGFSFPPPTLPPFSVSVLRNDPLIAAIYQTFSYDLAASSNKRGRKDTDKNEGQDSDTMNSEGFSAIFSMAGLDCLDATLRTKEEKEEKGTSISNDWIVHTESTLHTLERRIQDILEGIEDFEVPDSDSDSDDQDQDGSDSSSNHSSSPTHALIPLIPARKSTRTDPESSSGTGTGTTSDSSSSSSSSSRNGRSKGPSSSSDSSRITDTHNSSKNPAMRYLADDFTEIPFESMPHYR